VMKRLSPKSRASSDEHSQGRILIHHRAFSSTDGDKIHSSKVLTPHIMLGTTNRRSCTSRSNKKDKEQSSLQEKHSVEGLPAICKLHMTQLKLQLWKSCNRWVL
jgi:hypothetical protein